MNQFNPLCEKECSKTFTFAIVKKAFNEGGKNVSDKIVSCFYNCFREVFLKWALITYKAYPVETIAFIAENSFTDSVLKFQRAIKEKGLYEGKATIKTILFTYFRNTMLENIQTERRLLEKKGKLTSYLDTETSYNNIYTSDDTKENLLLKLENAISKMGPQDRQIVLWRHIELKSNEEIAILLNITIPSATNRIYRCMERLRKQIENYK
jgi:RNA polymerase sigma factor (sigma-70 family)